MTDEARGVTIPPPSPARLPCTRRKSERGLDLLISYRVYDPDGDQEETLPDGYEPGERGDLVPGIYASPAARREELAAMAAAAAPGGLAPRRITTPPVDLDAPAIATATAGVSGGDGVVGLASAPDRPDTGGNGDGVPAPAAGGWGLAGRAESGGGGGGGEVGEERGESVRRVNRFFGLLSRDEWIMASSSRIEKLNSRAPWKNSWTEEVRGPGAGGGGEGEGGSVGLLERVGVSLGDGARLVGIR